MNSDFLECLQSRGVIHQQSDAAGLAAALRVGIVSGYIGFDATASSLHVGNLVGIMLLRRLQQCGHKPIVLMGGGTTKVGDPSGKTETRQLLNDAQINANISSIKKSFENFLSFDDGPTGAVMVNNDDWLSNLSYIAFLREIGSHFTINRMLTMDSVKLRLEREQPLTFLEFNYMILQGYDFVELNKRYGCTLQMGGSDQWGNIIQGVELGRRLLAKEFYAVTAPLITTAAGTKMGKSVAGAVWLNPDMLSPYEYWQFWRNTNDADVGRFLRIFTDLPLAEIARLEQLRDAEINDAKIILATEATALCHGRAAASAAQETAAAAFTGGAAEALPTYRLVAGETPRLTEIIVALGLATSAGEAKRLIEQGGVRLNDLPANDITAKVSAADLGSEGVARLLVGKKRHGLIRA
jgi:tyrosyl-tRNA synthetase